MNRRDRARKEWRKTRAQMVVLDLVTERVCGTRDEILAELRGAGYRRRQAEGSAGE